MKLGKLILQQCVIQRAKEFQRLLHISWSVKVYQDYDKINCKKYWPEFAQNGKENITLRHVLSHQTGLFDIRNLIETATEMLDWQHMLDVVAATTPRFAAGQSYAYQPLTYGWILGGVIEKAAKQL